jgi:cysteine-rich repeat protein
MHARAPFSCALGFLTVLSAACSGPLAASRITAPAPSFKATPSAAARARLVETLGRQPLAFEPNTGKTDPRVGFVSRGDGYALALSPTNASLWLRNPGPASHGAASIRMAVLGANPNANAAATSELPGRSNYLIGNVAAWRVGVPHYAAVRYAGIYPGVDLVYHGATQRELEYDFVVAPGSDPKTIRLGFEGAERVALDAAGSLILHTPAGELIWRAPVAYQDVAGTRRPVAAAYEIEDGSEIRFRVASYDRKQPLVIDPVLAYSTFLAGSSVDFGLGIAVDASGSAYVTGWTASVDFPTADPLQGSPGGGGDVFITRLSATGTLVYSTYLGGNSPDQGSGIAVDGSGSAYVTGETSSTDFPTANPGQCAIAGGNDAFVAKLSPAGDSLVYATCLGGSGPDSGQGIAVDATGSAYVAGFTLSTNFPTLNALQASLAGAEDAFVAKLSPQGSLAYSTYLGGSLADAGHGIAVDGSGSAYVVGETDATDFPTVNALQGSSAGGYDGFVAKLSPAGDALAYSTYLGGSLKDGGQGIAVDGSGSAYVTGSTFSPDFPVLNAVQGSFAGDADAFVAKLSPEGGSLVYSTYLGGGSFDTGLGIAVDSSGSAYVAGTTGSVDFPIVNAVQNANAGRLDAFLTRISADGGALVYSTYFGDPDPSILTDEAACGVAVDGQGSAHVVGVSQLATGPDLASARQGLNGTQVPLNGEADAFVFKIEAQLPECSDGVDNADPEDQLADAADAGCHADGNPANPASYDPDDDDETDICGDGILQPGEQCDDGNNNDGDGCSSTCTLENHPPDCHAAAAVPSNLWPPDHKFVPVAIAGVTDPDGEAVGITVVGITQDEPVGSGAGCGNTCPDGKGVGTGTPSVRAERSGNPYSHGRVYHIAFTGTDPHGAVCSGAVKVCVPHNHGAPCVDQGPLYDSTVCH